MSTATQTATRPLDVRPLTGALGAEIYGLDLRNLDESVFDQIYQAFLDYSVLVFRDQALSRGEHKQFAGLYDFVARNERLQCRAKWTPNTLVMWDNRCVQHQAIRDYAGFDFGW